jgi:hypothetical protein
MGRRDDNGRVVVIHGTESMDKRNVDRCVKNFQHLRTDISGR